MPDDYGIPLAQPGDPSGLPVARPSRRSPPPASPSGFRTLASWLLRLVLTVSIALNIIWLWSAWPQVTTNRLSESYYAGTSTADDKIAVVRIDGLIMEGLDGYFKQQIRDAAEDDRVKVVVIAINSPGGSVTSSDELYMQIKALRDGKYPRTENPEEHCPAKKVVVSMESVAASGGYYIAVPADVIFAQDTTATGSIGVYASMLDLSGVPEKYPIDMRIIKRGELKAAGSLFKKMTPQEQRYFEEMIDVAYERFMKIVKDGRGKKLKFGLREEIKGTEKDLGNGETYVRRLADGGVFLTEDAVKFGLVDKVGTLNDAMLEAKKLAGLQEARIVTYNRPRTLVDALIGAEAPRPAIEPRIENVPGATARLWYLAPGYELYGFKLPADALK